MREFFRRLSYLLNRRRFDEELAGDMEFHREMAARNGGAPLGNTLLLREQARDAWGWTWLDRFSQDLRYAVRMLRRSPGFTLAAVLMLAAGIGANIAVFSFFDLMVLRPLSVRDPATLLRFHRRAADKYAFALPYPEMDFFRRHATMLSAVLALNMTKVSMEGEEKQIEADFVTTNFFSELGARPVLGRMLDPMRDEAPDAERVVVLSHGFWQRHFGGDALVVGRTVRLNGKPATVVGVAPAEFAGLTLNEPAVWAPIDQQPYLADGSRLLTDLSVESSGVQMWGRLGPGITPAIAEQELASLAAQFRKEHPAEIWEKEKLPSEAGGYAQSLIIGNRRGTGAEGGNELFAIFALVGALSVLILVVTCANLGSLLLARGMSREREIAIRTAVGAGRGRLIRQLLTESLLLALLGSAAGLAVGYAALRSIMSATGVPAWLDPAPDWRVIAFAAGIGFATAILFGLTPALQLSRQRRGKLMIRHVLVGAQLAGSCVLLIVAGLLARAVDHTIHASPGFEYQHVISIDPGLARHGYSPAEARQYLEILRSRLHSVPGVESVSLALVPPLGHVSIGAGMDIEGRHVNLEINHVDEDFFRTMRIPLLRGRALMRGDLRTVVVSESLARGVFSNQDPIGKKLTMEQDYTIVGVCGSARMARLEDSDSVQVYLPLEASDLPATFALVRTSPPAEGLAQSIRSVSGAVAPATFPEVELMKTGFRRKLKGAEYTALVMSISGSIAHLIACLGIMGLVSYAVSQRTREIGIRMALGAKRSQVLSAILRQFSLPALGGLLAGVAAAAALSQVLRRLLYGVSNLDPLAYAGVIATFAITVVIAALLPATRALRVDPLHALRHE